MDALNSFNWWWMGAVEEDIHGRVEEHMLVLDCCLKEDFLQLFTVAFRDRKLVSLVLVAARDAIANNINKEFTRGIEA